MKKFDPKMLDLDAMSTPGELSMDENDGQSEANGDSDQSEIQREDRPHDSFLIKAKVAPEFKYAKNKYDTYLTKTSLRAIKFSENKKRW